MNLNINLLMISLKYRISISNPIYPNENLRPNNLLFPSKACLHHKCLSQVKKKKKSCKLIALYWKNMFKTQFKYHFYHQPTLTSALALRTFPFGLSCCLFNPHYYVFHITIFTLLLLLFLLDRNKRTLLHKYTHPNIRCDTQ